MLHAVALAEIEDSNCETEDDVLSFSFPLIDPGGLDAETLMHTWDEYHDYFGKMYGQCNVAEQRSAAHSSAQESKLHMTYHIHIYIYICICTSIYVYLYVVVFCIHPSLFFSLYVYSYYYIYIFIERYTWRLLIAFRCS